MTNVSDQYPYRVEFNQPEARRALQLATLLLHSAAFSDHGVGDLDHPAQCVPTIDGKFNTATIVGLRSGRPGQLIGTVVTFEYEFEPNTDKWFHFDAEVVPRDGEYCLVEVKDSHRPANY